MLHFLIGLVSVAVIIGLVIYIAPKGWRTVAANVTAGVPVIGAIFSQLADVDLTKYIDPKYAIGASLAVIIINIILRSITTTPVGVK